MTEDSVLVSLISRSVFADSPVERRAAGILLDLLRTGDERLTGLRVRLEAGEAYMRQGVAEEVRALIAEYHLPGEAAPRGALRHA
ncbi:MAG TPA: hypothetical protein VN240_04015 [Propylenella sp.]|nr:hypothetical protein [Propylenella sp.]